jgi:hypothetical protein
MKRLIVAVLSAGLVLSGGVARAADSCYSPAALEAEQGMRFLIDLMVASTACRDQTYGLFQQRNKDTVLFYQKTMVTHFHGNAGFDRWDTALANEAALKQAGKTSPQACQEASELIKKATTMDNAGFRAHAASLAAAASTTGRYQKCSR